nr:hypothetical protein [Tanacetum cinerariifolium]
LDNTKTRRPQPRSNTKDDRVPSASKSSRSRNKEVKIEEHRRNSPLSKKNKHMSSASDASLAKHKILELEIKHLLKAVVSQDIISIVQNASVVDTSDLQTELERMKERFENCIIKKETEYAKLWNDWYKKCAECKYDKISYDKAYKDMQQKIEQLQAQLGVLKGKSVNNAKVNAPGMFKICPDNISREAKKVPNTVSASSRTKPITVSQPHVITKKDMNSNLNALSSTGLDNTKTKRPQPRCNKKHDRVPSVSKSSRSKNKEAKVEEHHRNLLLSKKNKHISSACNNSKIDSQDVISKVVCAMCKKCLISVNHDKCLRNYVNDKNFCGKNQKAKIFVKEIQKKYRPKLFKRVSDQKDNTQDSSKNTKFAKQLNVEILLKIGETNTLSKPVTSNSVSTPQVSKGVNNAKVIAPGMFRISSDKISREAKKVPNTVSVSSRIKPITVSQPSVIIKKNVNSDLNGLSSTGLDNTKTRRP